VNWIEVGHGVGFEAETIGIKKCKITLHQWLNLCNENIKINHWGMFSQPKFSKLSTLKWLCNEGMSFVRVGLEAQDITDNLDYLKKALHCCDYVFFKHNENK